MAYKARDTMGMRRFLWRSSPLWGWGVLQHHAWWGIDLHEYQEESLEHNPQADYLMLAKPQACFPAIKGCCAFTPSSGYMALGASVSLSSHHG